MDLHRERSSELNVFSDAALSYAARGWYVFPLLPQKKAPLTAHGVKDASRDPGVLAAWWREWPDANIGLDLLRSGLVATDLDPAKGGLISWEALCRDTGIDPEGTRIARTGSDGRHLLYTTPLGVVVRNSAERLGPGIDIRGRNGYIVLAPSVHPNGNTYEWLNDLEPAPFPSALISLLTPPPPTLAQPANGDASRAYARCMAYLARMPDAISGSGGHNATWRAACECARFGLSQSDAWSALLWFNSIKCQPAWGESELRHKLEDAFDEVSGEGQFGMRLAERDESISSPDPATIFIPSDTPSTPNPAPAVDPAAPANSHSESPNGHHPATRETRQPLIRDTELRDRYLDRHPLTRFGLGEWRRYRAGCWPRLDESEIRAELQDLIDEEARRDLRLRPTKNLNNSVTGLIQIKVTLADRFWDTHPDLLACVNGTLRLSCRELREHSPSDFLTSGVTYAYDPEAEAPTWQQFLIEVVSDADSRDFLQEFAGYSLTTSTRYELAVWLFGGEGGGKSTFIAGLEAMLGERAGVLGLSDIERSNFMLSGLVGKTLVTATEQPSDFLAAMYRLNAIISGEPITVDLKFRNPFTLTPAAKILWGMNDLPRVPDSSSGIFRRVKIVRIPSLPKERRNPVIKEAIKTEGAGILNWALAGLARLEERGAFTVPPAVEAASEDFRLNSDVERAFVLDACYTGTDAREKPSRLYSAYRDWCQSNGHKPKSSTRVAHDWERLGFRKVKTIGIAYWTGVQVNESPIFIP